MRCPRGEPPPSDAGRSRDQPAFTRTACSLASGSNEARGRTGAGYRLAGEAGQGGRAARDRARRRRSRAPAAAARTQRRALRRSSTLGVPDRGRSKRSEVAAHEDIVVRSFLGRDPEPALGFGERRPRREAPAAAIRHANERQPGAHQAASARTSASGWRPARASRSSAAESASTSANTARASSTTAGTSIPSAALRGSAASTPRMRARSPTAGGRSRRRRSGGGCLASGSLGRWRAPRSPAAARWPRSPRGGSTAR